MMRSNTFIIAREGWKYLGALLGLLILCILFDADILEFLTFVALLAVAYVYRNLERVVPYYQESSIVAVADGRIEGVETIDECPLMDGGPCYKLTISSSCLDSSLLRAPMDSHLSYKEVRRGNRLSHTKLLAASLNEKALLKFTGSSENSVVVDHLLEQSIDELSLYLQQDNKVNQGNRYGLMLKGMHTIYLPENSRVAIKVGDRVRAGETLLGYFA
ncbi:MAG: hypothetical protein U9Q62_04920 [Campylobacterota bacterium]|nr:hypothetical protein [Campylobacterota bacterium]